MKKSLGAKARLKSYLENLRVGSTINRTKLAEKFGMTSSMAGVSNTINSLPGKKFKFENLYSWERPKLKTTEAQKKLSQLLFGEDIYEISSGKRSKIISGDFNKNTMTPYRVEQMYNPKSFKDYGKGWNDLTEPQKDRVRSGKPPEAILQQRTVKLNKDLLKLSKDPRIIDIFKDNAERTRAQLKTDVSIVKKMLGKNVNAVERLTQLAGAFSGKDPRPGIPIKFKTNADNIFNTLPHTGAQRELNELIIGRSLGEKSIKTIKTQIRKNPNYIFTGDYNIDEPAGTTSSVRRRTTPYGIFGQVIDKELNQGEKYSFDRKKSVKEAELQKALKTKNPKLIKKALENFNKLISEYEKILNVDTPKGTPRIKLFKATLDSPINSIANFDTFNPEYQKAFLNNFNTRGYSFQVPRDIKTIPQIAELIQDPSVIKKMTQLVGRFAPRLLALPLAIGAGYAGVTGLSKLVGGTAVSAAEIQRDAQGNVIQPQAVERPQVIEKPETVQYNRETGSFLNTATEDKTDQNQLLQWGQENPLTAVAGTSVALSANEVPRSYKMRRGVGDTGPLPGGKGKIRSAIGIGGALKPLLTTLGTPAIGLGFESLYGKQRLEEGDSVSDILLDPLGPSASLAFMEPLSKASGVVRGAPKRGLTGMFKNYTDLSNVGTAKPGLTSKALRLGMSPRMIAGASRFLGLPGLALTGGLAAYDAYKNYQNEEGMIYNLFNDE